MHGPKPSAQAHETDDAACLHPHRVVVLLLVLLVVVVVMVVVVVVVVVDVVVVRVVDCVIRPLRDKTM